jgi:hypothetical protein|eukprot:scaffold5273_cov172-Chaetoceros_neogracile.AAC.2
MKFVLPALLFASGASAFAPASQGKVMTSLNDGKADLDALAKELNPIIPYFDPLQLADLDIYDMGQDATIGFLRQAEIKHSRVAMAAFVGYCVQSNFHWPWNMSLDGSSFPSVDLGPEAQWDAIPASAKWQILTVIGALEIWDETSGGAQGSSKHYMKGGKPGDYPTFQLFRDNVHWVLDLYDPFGFNKKMSQETKDRRLVAEINNGRLAMLGIFGFLSADKIEGSVPLLKSIAIQYDGQVMSPFESGY